MIQVSSLLALSLPLWTGPLLTPVCPISAGTQPTARSPANLRPPAPSEPEPLQGPATGVPGFGGGLRNVLVLLADDMGVDQLASYGLGTDLANTPHLDALAKHGVQFQRAYVDPLCSPSRAMLHTGKHGYDTGIGSLVLKQAGGLPSTEVTLGDLVRVGTHGQVTAGFFGKWHLTGTAGGWPSSVGEFGWDWFSGMKENLDTHGGDTWFEFAWNENGQVEQVQNYLTTETVDRALEWIELQTQPYFCFVAFNAPHDPYHAPPAELHSVDLSHAGPPKDDPRPYYKAMVEAMDHEIGRLLERLGPSAQDTWVIFLADNGTAGPVVMPPFEPSKSKNTPFEGGSRVPWIVRPPLVPQPVPAGAGAPLAYGVTKVGGSQCDALISGTDLFRTVADLFQIDVEVVFPGLVVDSVSLLPYLKNPGHPGLRSKAYAEQFAPNFLTGMGVYYRRSVREERYKLIRRKGKPDLFFDLLEDPFEELDLLGLPGLRPEEAAAFAELDGFLRELPQ